MGVAGEVEGGADVAVGGGGGEEGGEAAVELAGAAGRVAVEGDLDRRGRGRGEEEGEEGGRQAPRLSADGGLAAAKFLVLGVTGSAGSGKSPSMRNDSFRGQAWLVAVVAAAGCPPMGDLGMYTATDPQTGTGGVGDTGGATAQSSASAGDTGTSAGVTDGPGSSSSGNAETAAFGDSSGADGGDTSTGDASAGSSGDTSTGSSGAGSSGGETSSGETSGGGSSSGGSSGGESSSGDSSGGSSSGGGGENVCGNLEVGPGEQCDDGDLDEFDDCQSDCTWGPGKKLTVLPLPDAAVGERYCCVAAVQAQFLENIGHGLVLGGFVPNFSPELQMAAHMQQVYIPPGGPANWSYLEYAGIYGRRPGPMATAENGDVVVAGMVYTEDVQVDSGGYLWFARFAPDGAIVWSFDVPTVPNKTEAIAMSLAGDIAIVGRDAGFSNEPPDLRVYGPDGVPKWEHDEPASALYSSNYTGVAIDAEGNIYVSGHQYDYDQVEARTILRAFTAEGVPLWEKEHVAPKYVHTFGRGLVVTDLDVLLMPAEQYDENGLTDEIAVAAFDLGGELEWWKYWTPAPTWGVRPLAVDVGVQSGAFIGGYGFKTGEGTITVVGRIDAQGDVLWSRTEPGEGAQDLVFAPDGLVYVVTPDAVDAYIP